MLLEKNDWLGGKAAILEEKGFRFDMRPTILTMPSVLRKIWAEAARELDRDLELIRLDPQWRCFFDDCSVLDLREDTELMVSTLKDYAPDSVEGYRRFQRYAGRLHDISERYFFWKPIGSIADMFRLRESFRAGTVGDVLALKPGATVAGTIRSHVPDARAAQMLDHYVQYIGSSPYNAPAVLSRPKTSWSWAPPPAIPPSTWPGAARPRAGGLQHYCKSGYAPDEGDHGP